MYTYVYDEARKAETVLSAVTYIYIYIYTKREKEKKEKFVILAFVGEK